MTIKEILCSIGLHNMYTVYTTTEKRFYIHSHNYYIQKVAVRQCEWCDRESRKDIT